MSARIRIRNPIGHTLKCRRLGRKLGGSSGANHKRSSLLWLRLIYCSAGCRIQNVIAHSVSILSNEDRLRDRSWGRFKARMGVTSVHDSEFGPRTSVCNDEDSVETWFTIFSHPLSLIANGRKCRVRLVMFCDTSSR